MKTCNKCLKLKDITLFTTAPKNKDGRHSWCKECINIYRREHKDNYRESSKKYLSLNLDKIYEKTRARLSTPEGKRKKYFWDKKYRDSHAESVKAKKSKYIQDNREKVLASKRKEYRKNRHKYIENAYRRHYNKKNLTPIDADMDIIKSIYNEAKRLTKETGIPHEVDHIYPLSKGGLHHQDNLRVITWIENRKKGDKIIGRSYEKGASIKNK